MFDNQYTHMKFLLGFFPHFLLSNLFLFVPVIVLIASIFQAQLKAVAPWARQAM